MATLVCCFCKGEVKANAYFVKVNRMLCKREYILCANKTVD